MIADSPRVGDYARELAERVKRQQERTERKCRPSEWKKGREHCCELATLMSIHFLKELLLFLSKFLFSPVYKAGISFHS